MKLHDGGRAPNPRRVQIFLAEKQMEIDAMQLDLNAHDHRTAEFRSKNPFMTVPVLELDDGTWLAETVAICRYIEGIKPEPNLMGRDSREAAIIEMWQRRAEFYFLAGAAHAFRHLHPGAKVLEGEQVERWGEINQKRVRDFMEIMNDELSSRDYLAGDRFTIADITAFVAFQFSRLGNIPKPQDLENLMGWYHRINERPSTAWRE